jgi:hypothetical protein
MSRSMPVRLLLGAAAVMFAVACGEHASPTSPTFAIAPPPPPPKQKGHEVAECKIPKEVTVSKRIGFAGGRIDLGQHNTFQVLPGALQQETMITVRIPAGNQERVQFSPEGLQFRVPTILTLNYSPCVTPTFDVKIAYLHADTVVEVIQSVNDPVAKSVIGFVRHFSSYAVAY